MLFATATPNQYLLTGSGGRLRNRGSAVRAFLPPGTVWVLVPSTKQEATFEFTQETRDGIPLRFKGVVIYRITDPVAAASQFDFTRPDGAARISQLLTHVCLGELRHAVSHMTMVECIEQRKTTLSDVVASALAASVRGEGAAWGVTIEVSQVAQVFIVDAELRQQLEAQVRNDIRLTSDRSDIETREATQLAEMASEARVQEQRLSVEQRHIELELERFRTELAADEQRAEAEAPVRLLKIRKDTEVLREELEMRELRTRARALEADEELALRRAEQDLRAAILPLEQGPAIVEAAARVLQGTNVSIYGENGQLVQQLAPVFDVLARAVARSVGGASGA
jgi:hypothetical protein